MSELNEEEEAEEYVEAHEEEQEEDETVWAVEKMLILVVRLLELILTI